MPPRPFGGTAAIGGTTRRQQQQRKLRQQRQRWCGQKLLAAAAIAPVPARGLAWLVSLLLRVLLVMPLPLSLPLPVLCLATSAVAMRADRVADLRRQTVDMFYHGFDNYMQIAFPEDELRPVSCTPLSRDDSDARLELNDVLGNYSLTLIDSLSTLAVLASAPPEDGPAARSRALHSFQDGVAALARLYGDGRPGPSGAGQRARGFDLDSKVQVFETVIRGVGGLLSAHLFAVGDLPIAGYAPALEDAGILWPNGFRYDGQLLRLALDLATRLLPAFYTPTGLPYPRVNLRHGIPFYANSPLHGSGSDGGGTTTKVRSGPPEITETCSAGAGSLVLEFTVLSRLTGDPRFEQLAKRAFWAVWYRRSNIGLIGAGVDAEQGSWIGAYSVIGAGADSFFEYALKTHILLSGQGPANGTVATAGAAAQEAAAVPWHDPNVLFPALSDEENAPEAFLEAWHLAHAAIKRHLYSDREHPHYVNVNLYTGSLATQWIDSLGAYYPGLLVLAGEVDEAVETNLLYTALWARYAALPERWSLRDGGVEGGLGWWPLRPEFIESVYHLYRATRDPWYLYVGEMVQRDVQRRCWTACGWAGLQNVVTGQKADRMESFFLGETAKYMYLLYDDQHPLNALDRAFVFTTEGHPLVLPRRRRQTDAENKAMARLQKEQQQKKKSQKQAQAQDAHAAPPQDSPAAGATVAVGVYADDGFTNTCPVPPPPPPLTGSAVAARPDVYHAARMLGLHLVADAADAAEPTDSGTSLGRRLGRGPRGNQSLFPWTLPPTMLPENGTSAQVLLPLEMALEFSVQPAVAAGAGPLGARGVLSGMGILLGGPQTLGRIASDKIRVLSVSGLKLLFRLETSDDDDGSAGGRKVWRITRVNGVPLGRDEMLVMDRALVSHIADPRFTLVRDPIVVKLHHLHRAVEVEDEEVDDDDEDGKDEDADDDNDNYEDTGETKNHDEPDKLLQRQRRQQQRRRASGTAGGAATTYPPALSPSGLATFVKSVWHQLVSSLDGSGHDQARSERTTTITTTAAAPGLGRGVWPRSRRHHPPRPRPRQPPPVLPHANIVLNATGVTPTGLGAVPLPDVDTAAGALFPASGPVPADLLPWRTVYAGGLACDGPLPDAAVREHQVLVLRRGGCSFSDKLANVPSFVPGRRRLQLVVVVSDDDDVQADDGFSPLSPPPSSSSRVSFHDDRHSFVRPLLDEPQRTPAGLLRLQPLAMVMVGGGEETYRQLAAAQQLGLTRRYGVESQGVRVRNLLLDDGDAA